jgi:chemotaxis protein methyltransferase CheR
MAFTFFFRDTQTLENAAKVMIPEVAGRSRIRIWDAGCAMGPEPYTMAIILAENMGNFSFKNVYINATDIDEGNNFGEIINEGIYSGDELKRIPAEIFKKYFSKVEGSGDNYIISETVKSRIQFHRHNLLSLQSIGDGFSLIICKNVLLHFQPDERIEVIKMFHRSLASAGLLAFENTQKMPEEISHLFSQIAADAQLFRKTEAVG